MRLLIDSHILIWFLNGEAQLSTNTAAAIKNQKFERFVSKATLWEIAIKINLGKLHIARPISDFPAFMEANDFKLLLISFDHILSVGSLPLFHRDPFDRMLIAQALTEDLTVVTKDPNFPLYGVNTLW